MLRSRKGWKSVFESPPRGRGLGHGLVHGLGHGRTPAPSPGPEHAIQHGPETERHTGPAPALRPADPPPANTAAANLCARIEQHWHKDASGRERPRRATEEEIEAFEQRHSVRLPADLREYFQRLNGFDAAPGFFRFFPLSRLIALKSPSFATFETGRYFIFADYMAGTWYYAIYLGEDQFLRNRVILPDLPGPPILAANFSEFVELYLTDSAKLYGKQ